MKRKFATTLPTLYFRDNVLSIPGYTFEKVWDLNSSLTERTQFTAHSGYAMGGHRKHDAPRRGKQSQGWIKYHCEDITSPLEWFHVSGAGSPYVRLLNFAHG